MDGAPKFKVGWFVVHMLGLATPTCVPNLKSLHWRTTKISKATKNAKIGGRLGG